MKLAGIKANTKVKTPGYFVNQLLDELYLLTEDELDGFIQSEVAHD